MSGEAPQPAPASRGHVRRYAWVAVLYFAQGLPFGVVNYAMPVAFSKLGVSLQQIGLLALAGLPWTFKFLWAPVVDRVGQRRHWVAACLALMALLVLAFGVQFGGHVSPLVWALVIGISVFSATQDIAIDAATIEMLDRRELGTANGIRVTAYRIALIAAGSAVPLLASLLSWRAAWLAAALALLALAAVALAMPTVPRVRRPRQIRMPGAAPRTAAREVVWPLALPLAAAAVGWLLLGRAGASATLRTPVTVVIALTVGATFALRRARAAGVQDSDDGLQRMLSHPGVLVLLAFLLTFKLGDSAMSPMTFPFLDRGAGLSAGEIGLLQGTFGIAANIAGALAGGALTNRWGIFRALWVLGLLQAVSNFGYTFAALEPTRTAAWGAAILEQFCGGLGTAPFLAFMMSVCEKQHAATQYALLSAVYGLSRSLAGAFSGFAATPLGYAAYFAVTFVLALPAFALLPALRRRWGAASM